MIRELKKWLRSLRKNAKYAYHSMAITQGSGEVPSVVESTNYITWTADGVNPMPDSKVKEDLRIEKKPLEVVNELQL